MDVVFKSKSKGKLKSHRFCMRQKKMGVARTLVTFAVTRNVSQSLLSFTHVRIRL